MNPLQEGIDLDPNVLIQVQTNYLAQGRAKEVQMEAAIQQLMAENQQLHARVAELEAATEEESDANAVGD